MVNQFHVEQFSVLCKSVPVKSYRKYLSTERVGIPVMFWTRIWEVRYSNLGQNTGYPDRVFVFFLSLQKNSGIVPRLGHDRFLPNPFHFFNLPTVQRDVVFLLTHLKGLVIRNVYNFINYKYN
jgi:hypothetical protein